MDKPKPKFYILTEQQKLEIIRLLDELVLPGKFVRPLTNFIESLPPMPEKED